MIIFLSILFLILFLIFRAMFKAPVSGNYTPAQKPIEKDYKAIAEAEAQLRRKANPDEILEQASSKEAVYAWADIEHLSEQELIEIAGKLNKTQLRRWFNYHHRNYVHFPDKAYAFIQSKLNDQVWFSDEEFSARQSEGKKTTYVTEDDLLIEKFEDIFFNNEVLFADKIKAIDLLVAKKSKKIRLGNKISLWDMAYDKVKQRSLSEDDLKRIKSIKNKQTRAFNNLELSEDDIDFGVLDALLRK